MTAYEALLVRIGEALQTANIGAAKPGAFLETKKNEWVRVAPPTVRPSDFKVLLQNYGIVSEVVDGCVEIRLDRNLGLTLTLRGVDGVTHEVFVRCLDAVAAVLKNASPLYKDAVVRRFYADRALVAMAARGESGTWYAVDSDELKTALER
jgi:hypothetical protein